jgi:hypothetical protein
MKEESEEEPKYIICNKISESRHPITGSTTTHCIKCDVALWFAPSSHEIMMEHSVDPICYDCAKAIDPVVEAIMPSPGQIEEIIHELKKRKEK